MERRAKLTAAVRRLFPVVSALAASVSAPDDAAAVAHRTLQPQQQQLPKLSRRDAPTVVCS